jgi:hypothetical protein
MRNRVRSKVREPQHYKITLFDYLASSVPSKVFNVINRNNDYRMPNSQRELTAQIKDFVKKNGESGIKDLASIHPDKDLINSNCDCKKEDKTAKVDSNTMVLQKQDNYSDFSGKEFVEKFKTINTNMVILGAFVLLGVAYIVKSNK